MWELNDDEIALITHTSRFGSEGYPIKKYGRKWTWNYRSIQGPPVLFKTKREAIAHFELYFDLLIDRKGKIAQEAARLRREA